MDLTPCTYTPPAEGFSTDDATAMTAGARWTPPAGHASWCLVERAPWLVKHTENGNKVTWPRTCTCPKNPLAKSLRRLKELQNPTPASVKGSRRLKVVGAEGKRRPLPPTVAETSSVPEPPAVETPAETVAVAPVPEPTVEPAETFRRSITAPESTGPAVSTDLDALELEQLGRLGRDLEVQLEDVRYRIVLKSKQAVADGCSMAEVGRRVGLTRARIQQLLAGR